MAQFSGMAVSPRSAGKNGSGRSLSTGRAQGSTNQRMVVHTTLPEKEKLFSSGNRNRKLSENFRNYEIMFRIVLDKQRSFN
jgi:hypothetical protein